MSTVGRSMSFVRNNVSIPELNWLKFQLCQLLMTTRSPASKQTTIPPKAIE